ncbi:hypothetical protein GOODEAATRI_030962, partial [Goodea atripinnis]
SAFVRSDSDVGWESLAHSLHFNLSQRCSSGLRSGLCAGVSSCSIANLLIHVLMGHALCTGAQSCWNVMRASPYCFHRSRSIVQNDFVFFILRVPFIETPNKQPPF